ncbi:MAG: enoyl-CoA hydratase-related protein [Hyphomonadaceae bacterium]
MDFQFCKVERAGRLTVVTINRPEVMNALHGPAHFELAQAIDAFAADERQSVLILTGAGERAFCAGNDLKYQAATGDMKRPPSGFAGLALRFDLTKPVIAAVNGLALGGGFEAVLACDIVVASHTSRFGLPEPRVGMAAFAGGLHRLPRQIGYRAAMGMILTGRQVAADEALQLGLVNELAAPTEVMSRARAWAAQIMECSPVAVRASKDAVVRSLAFASESEAISAQWSFQGLQELMTSDDIKEGPRAFAEKRKPRWAEPDDNTVEPARSSAG